MLKPCVWFHGTVVSVETRADGDTHLLLRADPSDTAFLDDANVNSGGMVAELMPGQSIWTPSTGEHLALFSTWVYDTNNKWNEIHPVWGIKDLASGREAFSLPPAQPAYTGAGNA